MSKPKVKRQVITQKTKDRGHKPQAKVLSLPGHLLKIFICLFLIGATLAVFWALKNNEFVNLDDNVYVTENLYVQAGLTFKGLSWAFTTTHASNWHPLTWLSHMLDCQLFGLKPTGHHLTSLLLHIVNTLLLFLVLRRMTGALWRSSFVAALFALHPLHVESVAWVAERKDVLSTFFWMLTMWTYIRYVERPRLDRYLLVLVSFVPGLMAKPMLVTLPFVLLLQDYWPLGRFQFNPPSPPFRKGGHRRPEPAWYPTCSPSELSVSRETAGKGPDFGAGRWGGFESIYPLRLVLEKVPFFALSAVSSFLTFYAQKSGGAVVPLELFPIENRIATALVSYVGYIGKMIWPHHLAVFYPYSGMLPAWQVAGAGLLLVWACVLVIRYARSRPYLLVGWLWYLGTLVPVIGLVQVGSQAMADRYTYVPLIGLFIMMAMGIPDLLAGWRYRRIVLGISGGLLLLIFMIVTWRQAGHWYNSITLFEHALDVTANNSIIHNSLGFVLAEKGKDEEASAHYTEALRFKPNYAEAHNNLGVVLGRQGNIREAIAHYTDALRFKPNFADAHYNLGFTLGREGNIKEAIAHYREALRIKPDYADAHNNLGVALVRQGNFKEAIAHFTEALRIKPDYTEVYCNLGNALSEQGRIEEAITHYTKALQIKPDYVGAHYNLGNALVRQGNIQEAITHYAKTLRIKADFAEAHFALGLAYLMIGNRGSAMEEYKILKTINPDLANNLSQKIFR